MPQFHEILPFTLLDYPGEMACVIWFAGCNMRCVYCHNPAIVKGKNEREMAEFDAFLAKRKGLLTAVVFSGGEATLRPDLEIFVERAKAQGFKVKLDTNGTRPEVVRHLIERGLLDYVALDYKAPREQAKAVTGNDSYWDAFSETLDYLILCSSKGLGFEVRTTVHPDYLDISALTDIVRDLETRGYCGTYYLQHVATTGEGTIGNVQKPSHILDVSAIHEPQGFKLSFRNFPDSKKDSQ